MEVPFLAMLSNRAAECFVRVTSYTVDAAETAKNIINLPV